MSAACLLTTSAGFATGRETLREVPRLRYTIKITIAATATKPSVRPMAKPIVPLPEGPNVELPETAFSTTGKGELESVIDAVEDSEIVGVGVGVGETDSVAGDGVRVGVRVPVRVRVLLRLRAVASCKHTSRITMLVISFMERIRLWRRAIRRHELPPSLKPTISMMKPPICAGFQSWLCAADSTSGSRVCIECKWKNIKK